MLLNLKSRYYQEYEKVYIPNLEEHSLRARRVWQSRFEIASSLPAYRQAGVPRNDLLGERKR
jgi:hypothetical protein